MNTINTLTVNGQSYALPDPRSVLDDSAESPDTTWSGQKLAAVEEAASIVCGASGKVLSLSDASDRALKGLKVYGRTTQFTTMGKNLLRNTAVSQTVNGVTFTVNADGSVTMNGTATANALLTVNSSVTDSIVGGEKYTISGCPKDMGGSVRLYFSQYNTDMSTIDTGNGATEELIQECTSLWVGILVLSGTSLSGAVVYPMLRLASVADDTYEPYTGGMASPNPDYPQALESLGDGGSITVTVSGGAAEQSLTLATPGGLPGIPVASGGNYTDETGQAWVCDEINLARGVYVRSIGVIESYAGEAVSGTYMSTTGELSEGASVLYALERPVETALSDAELAAYAALHTNKPNTTVYNDASAHMALRYVADTKAYIDGRLAALAQEVTA